MILQFVHIKTPTLKKKEKDQQCVLSAFYVPDTLLVARNKNILKSYYRDFPGSPVVKTFPSKAGDAGSIPGGRDKISHASQPRSSVITNSIKILKILHIKKKS